MLIMPYFDRRNSNSGLLNAIKCAKNITMKFEKMYYSDKNIPYIEKNTIHRYNMHLIVIKIKS